MPALKAMGERSVHLGALGLDPRAQPTPTSPGCSGQARARREEQQFGVYVHWPFCLSKCPYCDFNSHVRDTVDQARWRAALLRELEAQADLAAPKAVDSVFFGGGTPSLMPAATVEAVLETVARRFGLSPDAEITLEANPSSVEIGRFRDFRAAGVNRVSIGVQSFDDATLRFLGRAHGAALARQAIETAAEVFERHSFDLIYALPGETAEGWRRALEAALDLAGDHLSLYQLTIEPNTGFAGQVRRGVFRPLDDDRAADLYDLTQEITAAAGLLAYETSNHARPGGASRHNLIYWRYGTWAGIGPGAHGRPLGQDGQRRATANLKKPEAWLAAVENGGTAFEECRTLPPAEQAEEALMMGLRLAEGIERDAFQAATGQPLDAALDPAAAARLIADGLVADDGRRLRVLPAGRLLLNAITGRLLPAGQAASGG